MAERAAMPLSICLSDPPGRDEAVAQEGAQNSGKKGSSFLRTHQFEGERAREPRGAHPSLTPRSPSVTLPHPPSPSLTLPHPAREGASVKSGMVWVRVKVSSGRILALLCCQVKSHLASLRRRVVVSLPLHPLSLTPVTLVVMAPSTRSGHNPIKPASQPRPVIPLNPTVQQMEGWDKNTLLLWIKKKKEGLLSGDNLEKFKAAEIFGEGFLWAAGDVDSFMKAGLPFGISQGLARLGSGVKGGGEFIPWT
jgi:hypothetical protein